MKLEHYIFLSLILAAAIVTGSTLCVAAHFPYLMEQAEKARAVQLAVTQEATERDPATSMTYTPAEISRGSSAGVDIMVITAAEKEQILTMLKSLGMDDQAELSTFIRSFQERHALNATGLLDSKTLHIIMEEAKLVKVDHTTRQASLN